MFEGKKESGKICSGLVSVVAHKVARSPFIRIGVCATNDVIYVVSNPICFMQRVLQGQSTCQEQRHKQQS